MDDIESYDYTEGASAIEIDQAFSRRRQRRDSQVGSAYDSDGASAIFGGPSASVVPSSVTTMHHERPMAWRRRSSMDDRNRRRSASRRQSGDSEVVQQQQNRRRSGDYSEAGDENDQHSDFSDADNEADASRSVKSGASRVGRSKKRSQRDSPPSSPRQGRSVFDNIANLFGTAGAPGKLPEQRSRRTSISSRRSRGSQAVEDEDERPDEEERWGYSSGEEDRMSDVEDRVSIRDEFVGSDYDSTPGSPTASLPLLTGHNDPFFGDTRLELGPPRSPSPPPPAGPPSRQSIYLADEDTTIKFTGYEIIAWKQWTWTISCWLSLGVLAIIGHWAPTLWLRWVARERGFKLLKNGLVVIETVHREMYVHKIEMVDYPYELSTAFGTPRSKSATPVHGSSTPSMVGDSGSLFQGAATLNGSLSTRSTSNMLSFLKMVEYRYSRYFLDPRTGLFTMIRDWKDPKWTSMAIVRDGPSDEEREQRKTLFGKNLIDVDSKSVFTLLIEEVLHPFYVFQIASIVLWSLDDYYYYAFCIALISTLSIGTTLIETKKTIERMREMSKFSCDVNVLSKGEWKTVDSSELIPGDVVDLLSPPITIFPTDMLVLSGDAIVNESMLTGESVPVSKVPIRDEDLTRWREAKDVDAELAKSSLYAGTRVIRIRGDPPAGNGPPQSWAVVTRTGFNTTKGSLIRSMLFPKPMGFKFYRDSMRFIAFLACLAGLGFLASAVKFVELGVPWKTICLRALDLITIVVPPALPATLSIGTSFAISRLRKSSIFCSSPNRVNVGGKVNVICFDKTGTLTEDGLDVLGIRSLDRQSDRFGELFSDVHDLPASAGPSKASFLYALATCHSLKVIDGQILGDPLDVKMFEFTRWTLEEGAVGVPARKDQGPSKVGGDRPSALVQTIVRPPGSASFKLEDALKSGSRHAHFLELGVIRTFEFVSSLRRMSVIVKRLKSTSMEVYVKGAPEVMTEICAKDSFPQDYDDLLSYYTKHGYRVIAIAGKSIEGLSWLKAQRMKRDAAESDLRFLGLIIFENKLKPGTTPAIQILRAAHLACRMVTGDNPRTAVSVARECGLVSQSAHVFFPVFIEGDSFTPRSKLEWSSVDDDSLKLDAYSLKPLPPPPHHTVDSTEILYQDYTLVLTGDVFRWMINHAPLETLQRMLVKAQVFARMSPDEKHELVERLQSLGYTVAFCGDGANDCGALKAADVGLSLSEAEASVAAPFTSQNPDISCMIEVIREGRAALVTSFSCFKYMALYSLIQFTTITLLYSFASSLGDFQFLYIDLFIIIPIAVFMGRTDPFPRIHTQSPTASLVSKKVLSSIIGQVIVTSAFQFWAFFWTRRQSWYKPPFQNPDDDKLETTNYENSVLFLVSCFQYILVAAVFSIGPPYRKPMWTNGLLMLSIGTLCVFSTIILLSPPVPFALLLDLMEIPASAKRTLFAVVLLNVALSFALERWGIIGEAVTAVHHSWRQRRPRRRVRDGKAYKAVEGGM